MDGGEENNGKNHKITEEPHTKNHHLSFMFTFYLQKKKKKYICINKAEKMLMENCNENYVLGYTRVFPGAQLIIKRGLQRSKHAEHARV